MPDSAKRFPLDFSGGVLEAEGIQTFQICVFVLRLRSF
jgi:hypothetical protein